MGICLIGGLSPFKNFESNFTEDQWLTLRQTCEYLLRKYPQAKVVGHREVAKTECPAFDVENWWSHVSCRKKHKEANDKQESLSVDPPTPVVS